MKNKIIYGLLSVVIAFGLWLYVVTVVSPESEATFYNVPVVLNNESLLKENGLMITENENFTVTMVLSGNRSDLNKLKSSDIAVILDLARIKEAGEQTLAYNIAVPGSGNITVVSSSPERITLNVAEWGSKEVDIKVNYVGSVPKDYIVDEKNAELEHNTLTITGPKHVIDQITQAQVSVDVTDQTQSFSQKYRFTLCDKNGNAVDAAKVTTSVAEVNVTVRVLLVKEIDLVVNTLNATGASGKNVKITIYPQNTIKVAGSERLLADLEKLVLGSIDLAEIMENSADYVFAINLPEGVRNYSGISQVKVSVQFEGMKTKRLEVTNLTENGSTPDNMVAKLPLQWEVILRGPEELIDLITPDDLVISVDLSDAELGEDLYPPHVTVASEFKGVEVIYVDDVSVTLTKAPGKSAD